MYSGISKGLLATPLAVVLPQTGNDISAMFSIGIGIMLIVLTVTLIMVEVKKRSS